MHSNTVNVSTGPVQISKQVQQAFAATPISHRSIEFKKLYNNTARFLCAQLKVQKTYFITGSGTAANEAMIWQIKLSGGNGLILSNGEFGQRLIEQATRASLKFIDHKLLWGAAFDLQLIEIEIRKHNINWVLFCHCETSTGVLNDFDSISQVCARNNCLCFVDCMSTIGTYPLDLSGIAMATASSGKGLASIPGLAIIFSNIETISSNQIPVYFDLGIYDKKEGIPFTLSSNLLYALHISTLKKLQNNQLSLIDQYSEDCFQLLNENNLLPFNKAGSKVFTVAQPNMAITNFIADLRREKIVVSSESAYLKERNWFQIAFFGYYEDVELDTVLNTLQRTISKFN